MCSTNFPFYIPFSAADIWGVVRPCMKQISLPGSAYWEAEADVQLVLLPGPCCRGTRCLCLSLL